MTLVSWSWLLVGLALVDWIATVTLVRASVRTNEAALNERAVASIILTFAASLIALLAIAFIFDVTLPDGTGTAALVGALLLLSLPQVVWWASYEMGRFR